MNPFTDINPNTLPRCNSLWCDICESVPQSYCYAPAQGTLSDDAVWRLSHTSGRRAACAAGRLDGAYWLIGAGRPAWLKAAAERFCRRPGRGHIMAAAHLQLVKQGSASWLAADCCCCCCTMSDVSKKKRSQTWFLDEMHYLSSRLPD